MRKIATKIARVNGPYDYMQPVSTCLGKTAGLYNVIFLIVRIIIIFLSSKIFQTSIKIHNLPILIAVVLHLEI